MANSAPHFPERAGNFSVDYRNHDGTVVLGEGDWQFRTKWSRAGNGSIHAYRNGGPQVAVAPGVSKIVDVTREVFSRADFSSRVRTPRVGEVVLWLNSDGYAAAALLTKVTTSPESQPGSVLEAQYRILDDKSKDFSANPDPLVSELESAIGRALRTFERLEDVIDESLSGIGIGHNNPPLEFGLSKEDYAAVAVDLRATLQRPKDEEVIRRLIETVEVAADKISEAVSYRAGLVREGFYHQMGAMAAISLTGLGLWMAFNGDLIGVGQAAKALATHLFGWP